MIEKFLNNQDSIRKWRRFKSRKLSFISCWLILISCFFSFTAEFWANNRPIMIKVNNNYYFPFIKEYHPSVFGNNEDVIVDYRELDINEENGDFAIWPLIQWSPYESNEDVESYPSEPSSENWLGTDDRGRDILTRLLYGLRYSIVFAISVWLITFIIGTTLGGVMGFVGGKIDFWGQRTVEILSTVPQLFLLIIIISIFKPSLWLLVVLSSLFGWIGISAYIRAEFLKNRKRDFVEAAKALGAGRARIFFKHILPNSLTPILTFSPFVIASNILSLTELDYLGFGLTPPTPSWGELLNQAQKHFSVGWWLALFPSLSLFLTLMLFSLVGEGVRDAMDPKK